MSGERRPAPRSVSSRRTGGQLGGRPGASAWGWRAREGESSEARVACVWLVRGSHRYTGSLHVGRVGGGVGGLGEPGRARGGSAGSLRREETPGPGWRPWEAGAQGWWGWGWVRSAGRLIGAKERWRDEGGGRFPTSYRVPLRKLNRSKATVKRRGHRGGLKRFNDLG